jgi:hypothetical protein
MWLLARRWTFDLRSTFMPGFIRAIREVHLLGVCFR